MWKVPVLDRCQTQYNMLSVCFTEDSSKEKKKFSQIYQPEVIMCCDISLSSSVYLP